MRSPRRHILLTTSREAPAGRSNVVLGRLSPDALVRPFFQPAWPDASPVRQAAARANGVPGTFIDLLHGRRVERRGSHAARIEGGRADASVWQRRDDVRPRSRGYLTGPDDMAGAGRGREPSAPHERRARAPSIRPSRARATAACVRSLAGWHVVASGRAPRKARWLSPPHCSNGDDHATPSMCSTRRATTASEARSPARCCPSGCCPASRWSTLGVSTTPQACLVRRCPRWGRPTTRTSLSASNSRDRDAGSGAASTRTPVTRLRRFRESELREDCLVRLHAMHARVAVGCGDLAGGVAAAVEALRRAELAGDSGLVAEAACAAAFAHLAVGDLPSLARRRGEMSAGRACGARSAARLSSAADAGRAAPPSRPADGRHRRHSTRHSRVGRQPAAAPASSSRDARRPADRQHIARSRRRASRHRIRCAGARALSAPRECGGLARADCRRCGTTRSRRCGSARTRPTSARR